MLVSCLLPTYNRYPRLTYLLEEAVECFLRQTYPHKELIICNDAPGQTLTFSHPDVRVINANYRFPTLGDKLHWMLEQAQGDYICRWDDDDISLPWRLELSTNRLKNGDGLLAEWRSENHWYCPKGGLISQTMHPGNTHIMSIWHRRLIFGVGVNYPGRTCPSGLEDQTFNQHLWALGYPRFGSVLPIEEIFYLYRWGTGSKHLSGAGGGQVMQETYESLASSPPMEGTFDIQPHWHSNHLANVQEAIDHLRGKQNDTNNP